MPMPGKSLWGGRAARSVATGLAVAVAVAALSGVFPQTVTAGSTQLVNEPFTNTTTASSEWVLPNAPAGTNVACLTAGTSTAQTPIKGCGLSTPDPAGSGALRLTADTGGEEGGVAYSVSVPATDGIDAVFDALPVRRQRR